MAAGFETTSNTLTTLCFQLAQNQDILQNLLEEVDDVVDKFEGVVNHETIADLNTGLILRSSILEDF